MKSIHTVCWNLFGRLAAAAPCLTALLAIIACVMLQQRMSQLELDLQAVRASRPTHRSSDEQIALMASIIDSDLRKMGIDQRLVEKPKPAVQQDWEEQTKNFWRHWGR